jgi:hypothetical protein
MASEDSLIGNDYVLQLESSDSPGVYVDACSIFDVSGLGETKPLVDVTTYCDDARAFRNGLREGNEVTLQGNVIPSAADVEQLFAAYDADTVANFRFARKDSPSVSYYGFSATILSWNIAPPIGDKIVISFTIKISGGVTRVGL